MAMPPKESDKTNEKKQEFTYSDETTPLVILPSPHSTDRSSWADLAALEQSVAHRSVDSSENRSVDKPRYWSGERILSRSSDVASPAPRWKWKRHMSLVIWAIVSSLALTAFYFLIWKGAFLHKEMPEGDEKYFACRKPLSTLDPVKHLGLPEFHRYSSRPSQILKPYFEKHNQRAIPTNSWYQNFLLLEDGEAPSSLHRAYTIPYIVDASGPLPGLRVHTNHMVSTQNVLQMVVNEVHGLTMGVHHSTDNFAAADKIYSVSEMTQLGISLNWEEYGMSAPITKGMAYATMSYETIDILTGQGMVSPAIVTEVPVDPNVLIDQKHILKCSPDAQNSAWVERELEFYVPKSDFTWLVFVSEPVQISCRGFRDGTVFRVANSGRLAGQVKPFHFRTALFKPCTKGLNPVYCHQEQLHPTALHLGQGDYGALLRSHAHLYSGPTPSVSFDFDTTETTSTMHFDWDVRAMRKPTIDETEKDLIVFALPHHLDMMREVSSPSAEALYCAVSLIGPVCLVEGSIWELVEQMPKIGFRAERPPAAWSLPSIAQSLADDIKYRLPDYFQRGVGDTYFSGKQLAKLGRILMIAEELKDLCLSEVVNSLNSNATSHYKTACQEAVLPSKRQMDEAVASLRSSVEIWINGTGATPFVFDSAWGGVASCGCLFNDGNCDNQFPDCPAFSNPGLNFGNAFYNDMHFHYGYHIFGAAVVAHFDHAWARKHFEKVLLLVRNIANPSPEDVHFPLMRHKDIYQGHSWASGIATWPLNGRNQESSSESLAAYESVALFGRVMASVFSTDGVSGHDYNRAVEIRRVGKLMAASELRAARKYYHVKQEESIRIYPETYTPHVVGIMWQTMAQFQTWFGNAPYLATGIQLLPLTPIAGQRDDVDWAKEMYPDFEESCNSDKVCEEQGWSILQLGALSTVGHRELALSRAKLLPPEVFDSAGGNGHSASNTLWFIATRAPVDVPLRLRDSSTVPQDVHPKKHFPKESKLSDCYRPETCTEYVLDTVVQLYTCRQRIDWLIQSIGMSQKDACVQVAAMEFPDECGKCNPLADYTETVKQAKEEAARRCPPCSEKRCKSDLNRCPVYEKTYVCTSGPSEGGCLGSPWPLSPNTCSECCDLTNCPKISPLEMTAEQTKVYEADCPECTPSQCRESKGHLCPLHTAPFICVEGASKGGCSTRPWSVQGEQCHTCCKATESCSKSD